MSGSRDILSSIWPNPLDYDSLRTCKAAKSTWPTLMRCVEDQCVVQTYELVLEALQQHRKVVLFGVDALPWNVIDRNARRFSGIVPVTSVAPTSSAAVWSSILRGVQPYVHGIHGVALYNRDLHATASLLSNTVFSLSGCDQDMPDISTFLDNSPGLFCEARRRFGTNSHMFGMIAVKPAATIARHLSDGAHWCIGEEYDSLLESPMRLLNDYRHRVVDAFTQPSSSTFVFCFLDLDTYFHEHPYTDPIIDEFLCELSCFAAELASNFGAASFLVSDHGMVRQTSLPGTTSIGRDSWLWDRSYARPGGAGRIHFVYPKAADLQSVRSKLLDLVGSTGIVLSREQYLADLAAPMAKTVRGTERIGELVAVATEATFPSVMCSSLQEHGSFTADEMIVGVGSF